jgi:hypothetical protein
MHLNTMTTTRTTRQLSRLLWRLATVIPLATTSLLSVSPATPIVAAAPSTCQFLSPSGQPSPIKHVIHLQFDNVHFKRDIASVPSDLEQMPHLLNFIENNGTLFDNEHTPLISHTANDLLTGLTGVYGDQHGITGNNTFEYYNNSSVGTYPTSAFTYWTDKVAPDPANSKRDLPFQMIDSSGKNLQAPWVPYVNAGCNFGAVSTVNMVLENNGNDVAQVFGPDSSESKEVAADRTNDFVGIAVHCADNSCSSVGSGVPAVSHAKAELGVGQGVAALYGHKYVASQVSPIAQTDGTPITGFAGFNPTASYTLGYVVSLLQANVPVVYGYISDAHDSGNSCAATTPSNSTVADTTSNGKPCGAYAPGEPGYVQRLHDYDTAFGQFFDKLNSLGINQSNMLFVIHADENDHYAGTAPLNPGCDGVNVVCKYDRTRVGEVTADLPLLLKQQGLYDFGMSGGTGATPGTPRPGFTNTDLPYAIDVDTAPGFWLKGHPANGSSSVRKLEGALASVNASNPYTGKTEKLFRFLVDAPGLKALHMLTSDADRNFGVVGFGGVDFFIQTSSLISASGTSSSCNRFPAPTDATCLSNGFIWLHGNFAPDIVNTWAGIVSPGLVNARVDSRTWADHADLRPTMMTLLCLKDSYPYEGRALVEDIKNSALPRSVTRNREDLVSLARTFKQLNAPVGQFGTAAIQLSTRAIKGDASTYARIESRLDSLVTRRDTLVASMQAELGKIPGCSGFTDRDTDDKLERLTERGRDLLEQIQSAARSERSRYGDSDDGFRDDRSG